MFVITVNAGSSSLRLSAFAEAEPRLLHERTYPVDGHGPEYLQEFLATAQLGTVDVVAHRIVHGGADLVHPCRIDARVEAEIERFASLAPLHNPKALEWVRACRRVFGSRVPQVAVFDTAFFARLPAVSRAYALPAPLCRKYGLRRYGFHGLAHEAMWQRWCELRSDLGDGGRVITLQLGAGCSITAIDRGCAVDTSMGFSPLEGLVMATRPGDLDPGLLLHLQQQEGMNAAEIEAMLYHQSGLLGLSGSSADMRTLLASEDAAAQFAVAVYCYRAVKYIGSYWAVLGGIDGLVFGGGVGEQAPAVRARVLGALTALGVSLDTAANRACVGAEGRISGVGSRVEAWTVHVDEAKLLARSALEVISGSSRAVAGA